MPCHHRSHQFFPGRFNVGLQIAVLQMMHFQPFLNHLGNGIRLRFSDDAGGNKHDLKVAKKICILASNIIPMKKSLLTLGIFASAVFSSFAQTKYEYHQMTAVESVVPGGLGRSRLITSGKDGSMEEIKLENFFSLVGINFGNIKDNDRTIASKIEEKANEGWELMSVTPGVYSADKSTGIFITRYLFRKPKN